MKLWDAETGGSRSAPSPNIRHPVSALAFSPDGGRLASASFDRPRGRVGHDDRRAPPHPRAHDGLVLGVAFSPDGRRLASAGEDKTVRVWDATTGREVLGLRGHTEQVRVRGVQPGRPAPRLGQPGRDHPRLGRDPASGGRGPGSPDLHANTAMKSGAWRSAPTARGSLRPASSDAREGLGRCGPAG